MSNLKHRKVAASFIFKFPDGDMSRKPEVALFRRSGKVRTYQHKYAPVSGSVEETDPNPLATAWRELKEETTLTERSLRLFRQGKPYTFEDESIGRKWTINPFGFALKPVSEGGLGEAGIQLDWEHEGFDWFDPDAVDQSESVPRILESLSRVWFNISLGEEAASVLSNGLITLQRDHQSGACQLASKALSIFTDVIRALDTSAREAWWTNVRFSAWHLWKNGRESMGAATLSAVIASLAIIEERMPVGDSSLGSAVDDIIKHVRHYGHQRQSTNSQIGKSLDQFIGENLVQTKWPKVLTLSCSSTIISGLTHILKSRDACLDIRVLESRPLFEGAQMADEIAGFANRNSIKANIAVYTDASVGAASKDVDVVLIGADLIDGMGNVSNKIGSLPAVLVAKHVSPKVKVVVLAKREKVLHLKPAEPEENEAEEVARGWKRPMETSSDALTRVGVRNIYFEWVPHSMIDHYITEAGVMDSEGIKQRADEMRWKAEQYFGQL